MLEETWIFRRGREAWSAGCPGSSYHTSGGALLLTQVETLWDTLSDLLGTWECYPEHLHPRKGNVCEPEGLEENQEEIFGVSIRVVLEL